MSERDDLLELPRAERRVFVNRTLNFRAIKAVGFDMDYTLVHYRTAEWEERAYAHAKARLLDRGFPVGHLRYRPGAFTIGLVVDRLLGNVVKANRFGFIKRAAHGLRPMDFETLRAVYSRVIVDLSDDRWEFMNTLFSLSEMCLFAELVELLDSGRLPPGVSYRDLYGIVRTSIDAAHVEGALKGEIAAAPDRFVVSDEELPLALLDLKKSGKKLMIITNSEWPFTNAMMSHSFDRFSPGRSWRSLFDLVVVGARKPGFFTDNAPIFEVVEESGLLRPRSGPMKAGGVYFGGNARLVEELLGRPGEDILYVGDHLFSDVHVTKSVLRWRTALIARELEGEIAAIDGFRARQAELDRLMADKERHEFTYNQLRLELQRRAARYGSAPRPVGEVRRRMSVLRARVRELDERIGPLSREASELTNPIWGPLMRAGNDKSQFARQLERYADVYTSRVSNFLFQSPFAYLRSPRGSLPHDPLGPGTA